MIRLLAGDCRDMLRTLPAGSVHCVVTSPPYFGLRDYGVAGQIGLEPTPAEYVAELVAVFREVRRVLRSDGTLWLNLGDSYAGAVGVTGRNDTARETPGGRGGSFRGGERNLTNQRSGCKPKDLLGIPWIVAFALRDDGWWLRQDIIWSKPNPMPESVTDRCTKAHEYLFLLSKSARYWFDADAIADEASDWSKKALAGNWIRQTDYGTLEVSGRNAAGENYADRVRADGKRNKRSVWEVASQPFAEAHFATFPSALIEPCILAGCPPGGTVLDPFAGAGTTGLVADRLQRDALLIELNPAYCRMARARIIDDAPLFAAVEAAE